MFAVAAVAALALAAPEAGAPAKSTPVDPDQKIQCHREEVTGSLAGYRKTCHTVAQWRQIAEQTQRDAGRAIEQGAICPACQGR